MICSSRSTRTSLLPWLRRARAIVNSSVLKRTPTPIARFVKLEAPHATRTHAHTHALEAELIIASTVVLPGRAALLLYYYYCDHHTYRSRGRYRRRCHGCRAACIEPLRARVDLTRVCVWPSSAACHVYPPSQPASLEPPPSSISSLLLIFSVAVFFIVLIGCACSAFSTSILLRYLYLYFNCCMHILLLSGSSSALDEPLLTATRAVLIRLAIADSRRY